MGRHVLYERYIRIGVFYILQRGRAFGESGDSFFCLRKGGDREEMSIFSWASGGRVATGWASMPGRPLIIGMVRADACSPPCFFPAMRLLPDTRTSGIGALYFYMVKHPKSRNGAAPPDRTPFWEPPYFLCRLRRHALLRLYLKWPGCGLLRVNRHLKSALRHLVQWGG